MVSKKTIGKIQLIIGIIILLVGIFGLVYSYTQSLQIEKDFRGASNLLRQDIETRSKNNYSSEFKDLLSYNVLENYILQESFRFSFKSFLMSTSIILIVLSLIFITQGLLNKSGDKNG